MDLTPIRATKLLIALFYFLPHSALRLALADHFMCPDLIGIDIKGFGDLDRRHSHATEKSVGHGRGRLNALQRFGTL